MHECKKVDEVFKDQNLSFKFLTNKIVGNEKVKKIILIIGVSGILLIFLSNFMKSQKASKSSKSQYVTTEEYVQQMQHNLESLVSNIDGAGKTEVLVTLENGSETVYAKEERKNKESSEDKAKGESSKTKHSDDLEVKYITIKESDGTEKALAIKELEPTVKGVVIVCPGGNNKEVRNKIIDAVKTALNITEKRVCVTF